MRSSYTRAASHRSGPKRRRRGVHETTKPSWVALAAAAAVVALGVAPMFAFAGEPEPEPSATAPAPLESPTDLPVMEQPTEAPTDASTPKPVPAAGEETPVPSDAPAQGRPELVPAHGPEAQLAAALRRAAHLQVGLPDPTADITQLEDDGLTTPTGVTVSILSIARGDSFCLVAQHEELPDVFYFMDDERSEPSTEPCV